MKKKKKKKLESKRAKSEKSQKQEKYIDRLSSNILLPGTVKKIRFGRAKRDSSVNVKRCRCCISMQLGASFPSSFSSFLFFFSFSRIVCRIVQRERKTGSSRRENVDVSKERKRTVARAPTLARTVVKRNIHPIFRCSLRFAPLSLSSLSLSFSRISGSSGYETARNRVSKFCRVAAKFQR